MSIKDDKALWHVLAPATWPDPPAEMSVSMQAAIQECPRRWALGAAEYPSIWSGRGYPPKLQLAALAGSVVHLALELITKQLVRARVPSLNHPSATQVLRELGGYTRIVEDCVERVLKRFSDNPRSRMLMEHAQRTLRGQVPTLRARVQSMLSRLNLPAGIQTAPASLAATTPSAPGRIPLSRGTYPEVELRAKSIGWKGKADLLVLSEDACEITDFKTGAPDESHKSQVRVYALLWRLDNEINPAGRAADRLTIAYEGRDVDVPSPSESEIDALSQELVKHRRAAEAALAKRPPTARPRVESCRYCSVRQLCGEYWAGALHAGSDDGRIGDVVLKIARQHGPTSWDALVLRARTVPRNTKALLRVQQPLELKSGALLRVLDAAITRDPEDINAPVVVTLGGSSEIYLVE